MSISFRVEVVPPEQTSLNKPLYSLYKEHEDRGYTSRTLLFRSYDKADLVRQAEEALKEILSWMDKDPNKEEIL